MSSEHLREFVNERLTAAAQEIFGVFQKTVVKYEEELDRQRRLLAVVLKPRVRLRRIELPQQHVCKEEEVLCEQQLCVQERNCSVEQEEPEPPQIKEEEEELCISQEGEQLELKQETDASMLTPAHEERDHSEDQTLNFSPDDALSAADEESVGNMPIIIAVVSEAHSYHQLLSHNSPEAESQDQRGDKHGDSGSTGHTEPNPKKRRHMTPTHEQRDHSEDQTLNFNPDDTPSAADKESVVNTPVISSVVLEEHNYHQLLSHNSPEAESQHQRGDKHGVSGSTRNIKPKPKRRRHKSRSPSNYVNNPPLPEIHWNSHTEFQWLHVCKQEEVLSEQQLCVQERNSSVEQEEPEPPQIKEEEEESEVNTPVISSVKLEHNYPQLLSHNVHELPKIHRNTQTELPQQHVCKEEEVLSEQQLCVQERNSSVDQEEPKPPQIEEEEEEEEEELCISKEGQQIVLMKETDTFMWVSGLEERDHSEDQTLNFNPDDTFNTETTKTGGFRFCGMSVLKTHARVLKLRSCQICGRKFINRAYLNDHMRSHSVEKLFPCITCGKDFRHRSSLMDHIRLAHANEKT